MKQENNEEKVGLYSKVKQNQPDICRFYKTDVNKHVSSIV